MFRATMSGREASWRELFEGFDSLKAITYSSGLDLILRAYRDVQGRGGHFRSPSRILSREHAALSSKPVM